MDANDTSRFAYELGEFLHEAYRRGVLDGKAEAEYLEDAPADENGDTIPYTPKYAFNDMAVLSAAASLSPAMLELMEQLLELEAELDGE